MANSRNIAVILAGGTGSRFGDSMPKQFQKVAGKKIIEHTIDVFENNELIDEIAVVCQPQFAPLIEQMIIDNHFTKVKKILNGGSERYHSSLSAIAAYDNDDDNLIFHDAVRPLVNDRIINDCILALKQYNAIDVAVKATDTIIQVDGESHITYIPNRSTLRSGQTPQCFKRGIIKQAYKIALADPDFLTTDDCGVVKKYLPDEPIYVVAGEPFNIKVTYQEDLFMLDKLFQLKSISSSFEICERAEVLMKDKVMVVFGGSMGIGEEVVKLGRQLGARVYSFSRSVGNVDVSKNEQVKKALADVYKGCGRIDYVVCTAGILIREPLAHISYEDIEKSVMVNYMGTVIVAKESFRYLKQSKGALLFYTSSSYTRGRMMYSVYSSTKAAIVNLVQALSEEWNADDIRVNCINPERTRTPMRLHNFGVEPEGSLLEPSVVAVATINTLLSKSSGEVIDVRRK